MRRPLGLFILLLMSGISGASSDEFDDAFCAAMTKFAAEENAKSPFWADAYTRQDSMMVDCGVRLVNWKKFVKRTSNPAELAMHRKNWSTYYCKQDRVFAEALSRGWTVSFSVKFVDNTETYIVAKCD